ncbi:S1 RNA-binding domain-containing protein [Patescibacteria group bacterium]|nr:S1 RNA-binding domain-containing protein [Patescibacteria group bacterium]MBU1472948.1 S1 RNA-binding domain-containing protein [Patescibacteria group bacterium]MBU2459704.1 S1 RNA-binding domain-containing protein [Patescibacteria group bacterium]MBU2544264.1 S1 RNA-binding domain-containing protein [Patescibacteria group bacterium]
MAKDKVKSKKLKVKSKELTPESPLKSEARNPKPAKAPQTMEELLAVTGYTLKGVKKGDVVEGKILQVTSKEVTIDVGSKAPGVVIDKELENYKDALMALKPGDSVVAQVIVAENDRGQSVLSLRKHIFEKRWKMLAEYKKSGEPVDIVLKESVRGGVLADYGGLRGYIPQSQLDSELAKQQSRVAGRRIQVKVIEADQETNRLVFSQRGLAEDAALVRQKEIVDAIPVGSTVTATVTGIVPFGAFAKFTVDKEGKPQEVEGLIHISEIAWEKVDDPGQYLKTGESIKVKVAGVDKKTGKITLSVKQLLPDPWEDVLEIFEKDSQVKGTVSRVTPYGIFVTLSPGIEGLVHISKISPGEEPKAGEEITCIVEDVRPEQHKISLSMTLTEKPIGYR